MKAYNSNSSALSMQGLSRKYAIKGTFNTLLQSYQMAGVYVSLFGTRFGFPKIWKRRRDWADPA